MRACASGQRSLALGSVGGSGVVEGVRCKIAGLQEALDAALAEQAGLERRLAMAARQHKADLSDAQLQIQVGQGVHSLGLGISELLGIGMVLMAC